MLDPKCVNYEEDYSPEDDGSADTVVGFITETGLDVTDYYRDLGENT